MKRRDLFATTLTGAIAATAPSSIANESGTESHDKKHAKDRFIAFTESFQSLSIPKTCEVFNDIGLSGLDLTVRNGGHIQPANAAAELPTAHVAATSAGLDIPMLTTGINSATDSHAREILSQCDKLGIRKIKLGYYRHTTSKPIADQLDFVRKSLDAVIKMCGEYDVLPCMHVHSGPILPANGLALYDLLKTHDPKTVGAFCDPMHFAMTGGSGSWRQAMELLRPWIKLTSIKNFWWVKAAPGNRGEQRWRPVKCPVSDGIMPMQDYVSELKRNGYTGIYTLHSEYIGGSVYKQFTLQDCINQTKADLAYMKSIMADQ